MRWRGTLTVARADDRAGSKGACSAGYPREAQGRASSVVFFAPQPKANSLSLQASAADGAVGVERFTVSPRKDKAQASFRLPQPFAQGALSKHDMTP